METPVGYRLANWSELHEGDYIYVARYDGSTTYSAVMVQVVDPLRHTIRWYKREHYDYAKICDLVPVVTPLETAWTGREDWPNLVRKPFLRLWPDGYRWATQAELRDGYELYVWGTHDGQPCAYGPFHPVETEVRDGMIVTIRLVGRHDNASFWTFAQDMMVKE